MNLTDLEQAAIEQAISDEVRPFVTKLGMVLARALELSVQADELNAALTAEKVATALIVDRLDHVLATFAIGDAARAWKDLDRLVRALPREGRFACTVCGITQSPNPCVHIEDEMRRARVVPLRRYEKAMPGWMDRRHDSEARFRSGEIGMPEGNDQ